MRRGQLVGWLLIVGGAHTYTNKSKTLLIMEIHLEEEGASIVAISA